MATMSERLRVRPVRKTGQAADVGMQVILKQAEALSGESRAAQGSAAPQGGAQQGTGALVQKAKGCFNLTKLTKFSKLAKFVAPCPSKSRDASWGLGT